MVEREYWPRLAFSLKYSMVSRVGRATCHEARYDNSEVSVAVKIVSVCATACADVDLTVV